MHSQNCGINEVIGLDDRGIESSSVAAWNGERNRVGFELGLHAPVAPDVVHKHGARKFVVNLVVEIVRGEGLNKEEPMLPTAAIERADCRRVISIFVTPPHTKINA